MTASSTPRTATPLIGWATVYSLGTAACYPRSRKGRIGPLGTRAVSLGKPNPEYARRVAEWNGLDIHRCVMVGDRLDTDIDMAIRAGMGSCFVLTGVDGLAQIEAKSIHPRHVLPRFGAIWEKRDQAS
mmetsp:Transcript_55575/g.147770  ORF Transcript_55575/g.147770 Transcript_55575/m.147770 type:complete len:128 (-) Transcript_55575:51-434(-)